MKINSTLFALFAVLVLSSCHRYYTSSNFAEKSARHRTIAVLPPQMVLTGNQPRSMSEREIRRLEEKESILFQQALYNNILKQSGRKSILTVLVQPYTNTLALFEKNNIGIRDAWTMSDDDLAKILGVDAVVRSTIQKDRLMSDLASAGIQAGKQILDALVTKPVAVPATTKTADIRATCSIVSNGETLWNDYYKRESNWNAPANEVIENITNNFAKHFPYIKKA